MGYTPNNARAKKKLHRHHGNAEKTEGERQGSRDVTSSVYTAINARAEMELGLLIIVDSSILLNISRCKPLQDAYFIKQKISD